MLKRVSLLALLAGAISPPTFAQEDYNTYQADFCTAPSECSDIKIQNSSSAIVTSVVITQEQTGGKCTLEESTVTQNLTGGTTTSESYKIRVNPHCQYKVKFKTTSGCAGDKTTHMKAPQIQKGLKLVQLKGGCGSLKVKKN